MSSTTLEQAMRETVLAMMHRKGWTVGQVATEAGVWRSALNHWLKAERSIRADALCRVLAVLGARVLLEVQ